MTRKYSVDEIGRMRAALKTINTPMGVPYYPNEVDKRVELHLQTYLLAGTDPEEKPATTLAEYDARRAGFKPH